MVFFFCEIYFFPLKRLHSQKKDCPKSLFALNFQDLLSWGYQIAKGMEYLASKRVIHGDLVRTWLAFLPSLNLNLITKWIIKIKSKNNTNRQLLSPVGPGWKTFSGDFYYGFVYFLFYKLIFQIIFNLKFTVIYVDISAVKTSIIRT